MASQTRDVFASAARHHHAHRGPETDVRRDDRGEFAGPVGGRRRIRQQHRVDQRVEPAASDAEHGPAGPDEIGARPAVGGDERKRKRAADPAAPLTGHVPAVLRARRGRE